MVYMQCAGAVGHSLEMEVKTRRGPVRIQSHMLHRAGRHKVIRVTLRGLAT